MPRTGATYNLPLPAVVTGTPISSSAYNTTLADIAAALTASVSRDGAGVMTAPLLGANGSAGLPMFSFSGDSDTGMFLSGTNQLSFTTGGSARLTLDANGAYFQDGTASVPSISFGADQDTGVFRVGANALGIAIGGINICQWDVNGCATSFVGGTAAAPGIPFRGDPDTGLFSAAANALGVSCSGAEIARFTAFGLLVQQSGAAATPSIRIGGSQSGFYDISGNINVTTAGTRRGQFSSNGLQLVTGSIANPAYSFLQNGSTGMSIGAANELIFSTIGQEALRLEVTAGVYTGAFCRTPGTGSIARLLNRDTMGWGAYGYFLNSSVLISDCTAGGVTLCDINNATNYTFTINDTTGVQFEGKEIWFNASSTGRRSLVAGAGVTVVYNIAVGTTLSVGVATGATFATNIQRGWFKLSRYGSNSWLLSGVANAVS